jgi:hypothetical protein
MNKSLQAALVKICTSRGGPLFHSSYDGVVVRKMSTQSIFQSVRTDRRQKGPNPDYTLGVVRQSTRTGNVPHGLHTGMGLALSCCKRKVVFFSGPILEIRAFSLVIVAM